MSLKSFVKRVVKKVKPLVSLAAPFIPGVGGIVATALSGSIDSKEAQKQQARAVANLTPGSGMSPASPALVRFPSGPLTQQLQLPPLRIGGNGFTTGGGFGGGPALMPIGGGTSVATAGQPMPGGIVVMTDSAGRRRRYRWSATKGRYVAVRKTNVCNPTALRRALRRAEGFVKLEKRVDKLLRRCAPKARSAARSGFVRSRK